MGLDTSHGACTTDFTRRIKENAFIVTEFCRKPIPTNQFDWSACFSDYDGAPDAGWQPVGFGPSELEAIADLMQQVYEHEAGR